jgi:hypothetical protein
MKTFEVVAIVQGNPCGLSVKATGDADAAAKATARYPSATCVLATRIDASNPDMKRLLEKLARQEFYRSHDWETEIAATRREIDCLKK